MKLLRVFILFLLGGSGYVALEWLWRGRSHSSMFLAGGSCFLLLGRLQNTRPRLPLLPRGLVGAGIVTMVEFAAGLLFNRSYRVWDYRSMPLNVRGQICLPFCLAWVPVSLGAMGLYSFLQRNLAGRRRYSA